MASDREKALEEALRELREAADRALALPACPAPEAAERLGVCDTMPEVGQHRLGDGCTNWREAGPIAVAAAHDAADHEKCSPDACDFAALVARVFPKATTPAAQPSALAEENAALRAENQLAGNYEAGYAAGYKTGLSDGRADVAPAPAADALREAREASQNAERRIEESQERVAKLDRECIELRGRVARLTDERDGLVRECDILDKASDQEAAEVDRLERALVNAFRGARGHGEGCPRLHVQEEPGPERRDPCNCWLRVAASIQARRGALAASGAEGKTEPAAPAPEDGHG